MQTEKFRGRTQCVCPLRSYGEHALLSDAEIEVHTVNFAACEKEAAQSEIIEVGLVAISHWL